MQGCRPPAKIYKYRIDCGAVANIFDRRYLLRIEEPLNIEKMKEAASYLIGTHDFKMLLCQSSS